MKQHKLTNTVTSLQVPSFLFWLSEQYLRTEDFNIINYTKDCISSVLL